MRTYKIDVNIKSIAPSADPREVARIIEDFVRTATGANVNARVEIKENITPTIELYKRS